MGRIQSYTSQANHIKYYHILSGFFLTDNHHPWAGDCTMKRCILFQGKWRSMSLDLQSITSSHLLGQKGNIQFFYGLILSYVSYIVYWVWVLIYRHPTLMLNTPLKALYAYKLQSIHSIGLVNCLIGLSFIPLYCYINFFNKVESLIHTHS